MLGEITMPIALQIFCGIFIFVATLAAMVSWIICFPIIGGQSNFFEKIMWGIVIILAISIVFAITLGISNAYVLISYVISWLILIASQYFSNDSKLEVSASCESSE